jgi:hypothetical protein
MTRRCKYSGCQRPLRFRPKWARFCNADCRALSSIKPAVREGVCEWCGCRFEQRGSGSLRKTCGKEHQQLRAAALGAVRKKRFRASWTPEEKLARHRAQVARRSPEQVERNRQRNKERYSKIHGDPELRAQVRAAARAWHLRRKAVMTEAEHEAARERRRDAQRRRVAKRTDEQRAARAARSRAAHQKRRDDARRYRLLVGAT